MIRPAYQLTTDGGEERRDVGEAGGEQAVMFAADAFTREAIPGQVLLTDALEEAATHDRGVE